VTPPVGRIIYRSRKQQKIGGAQSAKFSKGYGRRISHTHMTTRREYPDLPMVGVGGVVVQDGRALLIRCGTEPLKGEWSIPGGMLEIGETLVAGVERELLEETGLRVRVIELIEIFERISHAKIPDVNVQPNPRPQYHFVIVDYLCEIVSGTAIAGSDVTDLAFATEHELPQFNLTPTATRIFKKAFTMAAARSGAQQNSRE
jgi:ADP-ribose pyrophosphatase YjhB (NUDIX family)